MTELDVLRGDLADLEKRGGADYLRHLHNFVDRLDATPSLKPLLARFEADCGREFEASLEADLGFVTRLAALKQDFARVAKAEAEPALPDNYQPLGNEHSLAYFDWLATRAHSRLPPVETVGRPGEDFLSERMRTILYGYVYWARFVHANGEQRETELHGPLSGVASRLDSLQAEIRYASRQHHDSVQTSPGPHLLGLRRLVASLNPPARPAMTTEEFVAWAVAPRSERVVVYLSAHFAAISLYSDDRQGLSKDSEEALRAIRSSVATLWRSIERSSTEHPSEKSSTERPSEKSSTERPSEKSSTEHPSERSSIEQLSAPAVGLRWDVLSPGQFEELLAAILRSAPDYENVQLLMHPNAPDGGRDISAYRSLTDSLGETIRERVIVQCKHYPERSVSPTEVNEAVVGTSQWGHPPVDLLIVATSGYFTQPAVRHVEQHNEERKRPRVLPWSRVDLEAALASRPELAQSFGLR